MQLHELLRSCFDESDCKIFLLDAFGEAGRDVWDSTAGPWKSRASEVEQELRKAGLAGRRLFEALVKARPGRADDIAAVCRSTTGEPFNYAVGAPPASASFPWPDYRAAMSASLVRLLRFAAHDARSRGFSTISTSEIVRVYGALQPWVCAALPLEKSQLSPLGGEEDPFDGAIGASACVGKTIHGLARFTELPATYTEHDVFLDLMRFGSGSSVRRLAPNGASLEEVNKLSRDLDIGRMTRHGHLDRVDG